MDIENIFKFLQVYEKSKESERCRNIHRLFSIECFCAFAPGKEGDKTRLVIPHNVLFHNKFIS